MISVAIVHGFWRVLVDGQIAKTFVGPDAEAKARGYALAMLDGRQLEPR